MTYQAIIKGAKGLYFFNMLGNLDPKDQPYGWNWTFWRRVMKPLLADRPGIASAELRGKPRLLNVFASWCIPCIAEAPQLLKVSEGGEFKRGTIAESKESYRIETYGRVVAITRQVLINDDLDAFTRATGRELNEAETNRFRQVQLQANRWTYLGSAMTHERVLATLERLSPKARKRVEGVAPAFC